MWTPTADLSAFEGHALALPEGFEIGPYRTSADGVDDWLGALADGTFVANLERTSDGAARAFALRFDAAGEALWTELAPPAGVEASGDFAAMYIAEDDAIIIDAGAPADAWVAFRPEGGGFTTHVLPALPDGGRAAFTSTVRPREISGQGGELAFVDGDPATRVGIYRPTDAGYALELLPTISGEATARSKLFGVTSEGAPVAQLDDHAGGYRAATWIRDGTGGWDEILLGVADRATFPWLQGQDRTIVGFSWDPVNFGSPLTTWTLDGASPDPGEPGPRAQTFAGQVAWTGGDYVVGKYGPWDQPKPLVWGPGIGDDPTGDGWGYVELPLPNGVTSAETRYVTPDGFVVGQGTRTDGERVGIGWRPVGDGTWTAELLDHEGSAEMTLQPLFSWSPYEGEMPRLPVSSLASGGSGRLIIDPAAPGGFRVLTLTSQGNIYTLSHDMGMIGGSLFFEPVIAYHAEGSLQLETLPFTGTSGHVTDIHDGVVAGRAGSGAAAWRHEGGAWVEYPLGPSTASHFSSRIVTGGHVLVTTSDEALTLYRWEGDGYAAVPLTLEGGPDDGRAYRFNSTGTYHSTWPFVLEAIRDGLFIVGVASDSEEDQYVVFGVGDAGDAAAPWVSLGTGVGTVRGYPLENAFLVQNTSGDRVLHRVHGDADHLESITLAAASEGFGSYDPGVLQGVDVIALSGGPPAAVAVVEVTGADGLDPDLDLIHGPEGSVFAKIAIDVEDYSVHPIPDGALARFSNTSNLRVWGCQLRPTASFDAMTVDMRASEAPAFTYVTEVADVCQTTASATVSGATSTPQITTANDQDSASLAVETADVSVALDVDRRLVVEGNDLTYSASAYNAGPYPASDVTVTLTPPAGSGLAPVEHAVGTLAVGESWTQDLVVPTAGRLDGDTLSANATVTTASLDCVATNHSSTATATVSNQPNAYVDVAAPSTARLLAPFTIHVSYGNDSDNGVAAADIAATLPPELTLVSGQPTLTDVAIPAGTVGGFDLEVIAGDCEDLDATVTSTATLAAVDDLIASDNLATADTRLLAPAGQLALVVMPDRPEVAPGGLVRWTATIRNDGLQPVSDAVLEAAIPAGTQLVAGSLTHGTADAGVVTAPLVGEIGAGQARQVGFTTQVTAPEGATLGGQATVSATGSCDQAAAYAPAIVQTPTVAVSKAADRATACGDGPITWTISVANPGDTVLADVVVTDVLPPGVVYVGGSIGGGDTRQHAGGTLTWSVATLAPGQAFLATFQTLAPASHGSYVNNTASVTAGGVAVGSSNTATVAIDCEGGLSLTKAWDGDCQAPGGEATVTVGYAHTGAAPLSGGVLVDRLPSALEPRLPVAGATWDAEDRTLTFALGTIAPGEDDVSYMVDILAEAPQGEITLPGATITASGTSGAASSGVSGLLLICDDGNACTADTCEPGVGCVSVPEIEGTPCDDGDLCAVDGTCLEGACVTVPKDCAPDGPCELAGECNPATGECDMTLAPDETPCDDGVACTDGDQCLAGECAGVDACAAEAGMCDVDGFCNPETDQCEFEAAICAPEVHYALVVDASGELAGAIRCTVAGVVECDENPDGTLTIHADVRTCAP